MGLLVAGCAQFADLGAGPAGGGATPDSGPVDPARQTDENIEITPAALDYGSVECGTEPAAKLITIHNNGGLPALYEVKLPAGTSFRLQGDLEGTLAPRGTKTIEVFATPRAAGDNTADVSVTAGKAVQAIRATAKGSGATFELAQSTIAFGDVRKENGSTPVDVAVKNTGTDPVSVSAFTSSNPAFDIAWNGKPGAFTVPAGGSSMFQVTLKGGATADDPAQLTATIKPNTTKFCGAAPLLTVSGRRVTSEVTVNPADWGRQPCGTSPGSKDIVITNYAKDVVNYSLIPAVNSAFTIVSPGPMTVPLAPSPGQPQTAVIKVAPKTLGVTAPLLDVKELLGVVLASTAPGVNGRRDVQLHVETRGAIITVAPATLAFTSSGAVDKKPFTVTNTGNEDLYFGTWSLNRTSANGTTSWTSSTPGGVAAGGTSNGTVSFTGVDTGVSTATLTPAQSVIPFFRVPECKSLGALTLSGTKP